MGSRLKQNPERTFYWFFEASCPIARDKDPGVLSQFPEDFSDEESIQTLPRFCFPYDIERVKETVAIQHFTFVLTDLEGCYLPWFEVFYKLLNNLADYLTKGQTNEMRELLSALYKHPVPQANSSVTLQLIPYFIAPDPRSLPSIPESRNLTELMVAVDIGNLLHLYASMLFERRILISSSKLSTLTACVHACSGVLYPMYWQHIFIPVLPPHLLDYCCAPMPYLIGVHSSLMEKVRSRALEDVVILNVDTNTMESPFEDLKRIPSDVLSVLKVRLKKQSAAPGSGVARAFLKTQALLFGGYRDALVCPTEGGPIKFCEESFLNHKSQSMRHFLESAVHLQFFKQFIDGRLEQLNNGREPVDLFEEEISQCGESTGGGRSYQQFVGNLKKGGGALILTVKSKANMCKSAKIHAKSSLKNFLSPKEDSNMAMLYRGGSLRSDASEGSHVHRRAQNDCLQSRLPITQHFGKSRPRRPARRYASRLQEDMTVEKGNTWRPDWEDRPVDEEHSSVDSSQAEDSTQLEEADGELLPDPEELDLLGEIFDTLSSRSAHERGLLYGTRSLDLFGPDSSDYFTRREMATPSQESLSNSIGRSGSLLSWGLEEGLEGQEEGLEGQEEGPDEQGEGLEGQGEGPEGQGAGPDGKAIEPKGKENEVMMEQTEQKQMEDPGSGQGERPHELYQAPGAQIQDCDQKVEAEGKEEVVKEDEVERNKQEERRAQEHLEESQSVHTQAPHSPKEPPAAPNPSHAPSSQITSGGEPTRAEQRAESGQRVWLRGQDGGSSPQISTGHGADGQEAPPAGPGAGVEGEGASRSPRPRVRSALTLFQGREAGAWPASALQRPGMACRGGNSSFLNKSSPQAPPTDRSPAPTAHTDPDTDADGEEETTPVKVSELKKRFEA
ncbi:hypothetical protein AGOR_G00197160 [Albula goreensis]|uniref:UDENN domain-containing protein n=1 Tax=Albula goreensis TaxID=1534307 RepID=A0A8T3CN48_9TELE|nr:hypothetical protein AGOR_G00197160 [Albula goreensis]